MAKTAEQGVAVIEDMATDFHSTLLENVKLREVLLDIAFADPVNTFAADPSEWDSTKAYEILGGRMAGGVRLDTKEDLRKR